MKFRFSKGVGFPYQETYITLQIISFIAMIVFGIVQKDAMVIVRYLAIVIILEMARRVDKIARDKN